MFCETGSGVICINCVRTIDLFGVNSTPLCPLNQRAAPLDSRGGSDGPAIVLYHHQHRQLMHSSLAKERVKVVGCRATVACSEEHDIVTFMPFQRESHSARERRQRAHFAKRGQNAMLLAAIV